jgi:hypothetical protein
MTSTILSLITAIITFALAMFKEASDRQSADAQWKATQAQINDMQIKIMSAQIDKIRKESNQATNINNNPPPHW